MIKSILRVAPSGSQIVECAMAISASARFRVDLPPV
jgi:hypothetical protein